MNNQCVQTLSDHANILLIKISLRFSIHGCFLSGLIFYMMATDFSIPALPPPLPVALGHYKQKLFLLFTIHLIFIVDLWIPF